MEVMWVLIIVLSGQVLARYEDVILTQHPSPVTVGQPVVFRCNATCFPLAFSIQWYLDPPVPHRSGSLTSSPSLRHPYCFDFIKDIFLSPTRNHTGLVATCVAASPDTVITMNAALDMQGPPLTSTLCVRNLQQHACYVCENCTRNVTVGDSLDLECTAVGSNPVSHLIWDIDHGQQRWNVSKTLNQTEYLEVYDDASWSYDVVSKATVDIQRGEGFFGMTCRVLYPGDATVFTEKYLGVFVMHQGPDLLNLTNYNSALTEGWPVVFTCTAVCVRKPTYKYHFRWYVNEILRKSEEDARPEFIQADCYNFSGTFTFTPVRTDAGKRVKCVATSEIGVNIENATAPLAVSYKPEDTAICVTSGSTCDECMNCTRNVTEGANLELRCTAVGSNPTSHFAWEVNGRNHEGLSSVIYHDHFSSMLLDNETHSWYSVSKLYLHAPSGVNSIDVVCLVLYPDSTTTFKEEYVRIVVQTHQATIETYQYFPWKLLAICAASAAGFALVICLCSLVLTTTKLRAIRHKEKRNTEAGARPEIDEVSVGDAPASSEIAVQVPETPAQVDCPDFEFRREGIHLEEVIGNGFYGQVVKAKSDGILEGESTTVAVKILKGHASTTDFKNELAIFRALEKHPFVVSFLGSCTEKEPFYMIMEYVPNGTLEAFITRKRLAWTETRLTGLMKEAMNPLRILLFGFQIASGMEYLSSKHLVHRDLATRNVLLDEGLTCKLCDFGLARDVKGIGQYTQKSGNAIPFRWLALECIRDSIYTTKSDVWSFGVLMWELLTLGAQPYTDMSFEAMVVYLLGGFRLPRPAHCGEEIYVLMSECWTTEPEFRPSFTDLRQRLDCLLKLDSKLMDMSQFTSDVYLYQNPLVQTYLLGEA